MWSTQNLHRNSCSFDGQEINSNKYKERDNSDRPSAHRNEVKKTQAYFWSLFLNKMNEIHEASKQVSDIKHLKTEQEQQSMMSAWARVRIST